MYSCEHFYLNISFPPDCMLAGYLYWKSINGLRLFLIALQGGLQTSLMVRWNSKRKSANFAQRINRHAWTTCLGRFAPCARCHILNQCAKWWWSLNYQSWKLLLSLLLLLLWWWWLLLTSYLTRIPTSPKSFSEGSCISMLHNLKI